MNEVDAKLVFTWQCPFCGTRFMRDFQNFNWGAYGLDAEEMCTECLEVYKVIITNTAWKN